MKDGGGEEPVCIYHSHRGHHRGHHHCHHHGHHHGHPHKVKGFPSLLQIFPTWTLPLPASTGDDDDHNGADNENLSSGKRAR